MCTLIFAIMMCISCGDGPEEMKKADPPRLLVRSDAVRVTGVDVSGQFGEIVTGGDNGRIELYSIRDGRKRLLGSDANLVAHVKFSQSGRYLAAAGFSGVIRLFARENGELRLRKTLDAEGSYVYAIRFDDAEKYLFSLQRNGVVRRWEVADGRESVLLSPQRCDSSSLALISNERLSVSVNNLIWILDPTKRTREKFWTGVESFHCLAASKSGEYLAAGDWEGRIIVWETKTGMRVSESRPTTSAILDLQFLDGRQSLISLDAEGGIIFARNFAKLGESVLINKHHKLHATSLSRTASAIFYGDLDGFVGVYQLESLKQMGRWKLHDGRVTWTVVDTRNHLLVSAGRDGRVFATDISSFVKERQKTKADRE